MILSPQFETFLAVARSLNFTKAGEKLGLTQSAVSQQIQTMEDLMGTLLFHRKGRGVELTEAGQHFYREGLHLEKGAQVLERSLKSYTQGRRSFRIGATLTVGEFMLPPVLAQLQKEERNYDLQMDMGNTKRVLDQLSRGILDCAVIEGPFDQKEFLSSVLWRDEMVFVHSPDETMPEQIGHGELKRLILREEGSGTLEYFMDYLRRNSIVMDGESVVMRVGSLTAIKSLVMAGMGRTVISRQAVKRELDAGLLKSCDMVWGPLNRDLTLVYRDNSPRFFVKQFQHCAMQYRIDES